MSERGLKRLVGALVIVVALWAVTSLLSGGGGSIAASGAIAGFFDEITPTSVDVVRLDGSDGPIELLREDSAWTANGFEADAAVIGRMFAALYDVEIGDLVATNPANHDRMGVSQDSAVTFEVQVSGETRTILVGKTGPRFATAYGRLPDEDEVYLIEGDLRVHVTRRLDDWRNKQIVAIDTSRAVRLEVERDGDAYTLVRGDSAWTFEDGAEAVAFQVRNILAELSSLIAAGFVMEGDSLYASPPGGVISAYSADGVTLATVTIGEGEGERWVRASGNDVVYRLSTFRVGRLAPTREAMEPES